MARGGMEESGREPNRDGIGATVPKQNVRGDLRASVLMDSINKEKYFANAIGNWSAIEIKKALK